MNINEIGLNLILERLSAKTTIVFNKFSFGAEPYFASPRAYLMPYVHWAKAVKKNKYVVRRFPNNLDCNTKEDDIKHGEVLLVLDLSNLTVISITDKFVEFEDFKIFFNDNDLLHIRFRDFVDNEIANLLNSIKK